MYQSLPIKKVNCEKIVSVGMASMNNRTNSNLQLKMLSGPHVGAEVGLKPGTYNIGQGDHCDLIFHDCSIADRHAVLQVSENGAIVKPLNGEVLLNNRPIHQGGAEITPTQIITIGNSHICVGPKGTAWPKIKVSIVNAPTPFRFTQLTDLLHRCSVEKITGNFNMPELKPKKKLVVPLVLVVSIFAIGHAFSSSPEKLSDESSLQIQRLNFDLKTLGLPNIDVKQDGDHFKVEGYVDTTKQKLDLGNLLNGLTGSVTQRVRVNDQLAISVESVLTALDLQHIKPLVSGRGDITVSGYTQDRKAWDQARTIIHNDIAGVGSINDDALETKSKRLTVLDDLLKEKNLDKKIVISNFDTDNIAASGDVSQEEINIWNRIKQEYNERYPAVVVQDKIHDVGKSINLDLKSVSIGEFAYLVSKDGKTYLPGAHLGQDYYVKEIQSNRILLSHNEQEFFYYLGEGNGSR